MTNHVRRLVEQALEDVNGYSLELNGQFIDLQERIAELTASIGRAEAKSKELRAWLKAEASKTDADRGE